MFYKVQVLDAKGKLKNY